MNADTVTLRGILDFLAPQTRCMLPQKEEGEIQEGEIQVKEGGTASLRQPSESLTVALCSYEAGRTSERAMAVEAELLASLLQDTPAPESRLLSACLQFRVSLEEVEPLVLPPWALDTAFPSREVFFSCLSLEDCFQQWPPQAETGGFPGTVRNRGGIFFGEFGKTSSDGLPLFQQRSVCSFSCRWAQLLDGTVLARLMSSDLSGLCLHRLMVPERFRATQALLTALRRVLWSPRYAWIFPAWHQHRMALVSWLGKELGFGALWAEKVVPFLPIEPFFPGP